MRRQEAYASGREAGWYQWPVGRYCVARLVPQWCRPEGVCLMTLLTGLLMLAGGCSHSTAVLKQEAVPKAMAASFSPSAFLDEPPQKAKKPDEKAETPSPKGVAAANTSKKKAPYPEIPIKSSDERRGSSYVCTHTSSARPQSSTWPARNVCCQWQKL